MQCKRRYILLAVCGVFLVLCVYIGFFAVSTSYDTHSRSQRALRSYVDQGEHASDQDSHVSARQRRDTRQTVYRNKKCRMETCFDYSLCKHGFKIYIYPTQEKVSSKYSEILTALRESRYHTRDPTEACLFIPAVDTLDRDKLSQEYVKNIHEKIESLPYWRGGKNHVIFNLYSGTWPDYGEDDLGFNTGMAILAKASFSESYYRPGFDISFPLFHKEHAFKGGDPGFLLANNVPPVRKYVLVFKGKRYLTGIGSETRNSLYHIHNDQDIILLTTCKHGKGWKNVVDERCDRDNAEYDKHDYKVLLHNSTFCLVPRGRRLGSYRFLEALQAACIPVLLSNNWVLPFAEVIDWNKAVIWGDERLLLQIPSIVRSISHADILMMRQQNQFIWDTYFSSIEKIVATTLEILKDQVYTQLYRSPFIWNSIPGALAMLPEFADSSQQYPFYLDSQSEGPKFTAVIYATSPSVMASSPLYRLVKNLGKSVYLDRILILWKCDTPPPINFKWPVSEKIAIIFKLVKSLNSRFKSFVEIHTAAVLSLDEDAVLSTDEVDFAFHVWTNFPNRIVGYPACNHFWDDSRSRWGYTSKMTNDYSIVLTGAAFYHKYYGFLYTEWLSDSLHRTVDQFNNCEDIFINMLVSHVTKYPPIKVTQRKTFKESMIAGAESDSEWMGAEHFMQRQKCINTFVDFIGYMPLIRTNMRFDPLLYKDPVSIMRKKYRQIETVS